MMKFLICLLILMPLLAHSLEVDEKLTIRIIKTSESRKTLMVNRGTEDGLVEGDHARFIVTAGIVARAVCVNVSPTRSVWSVYRLVNADFIATDAVMTLKITPPVKITKDETQAIVEEDTPSNPSTDAPALGIPLADGAQDLSTATTGEEAIDQNEIRSLEDATISEKNVEIFGIVHISGLSATSKSDVDETYNDTQAYHHISLGGELYPQKERDWYSRFSLMGAVNLMRLNSQSYDGNSTNNDVTEFEAGVNWHPGNMPSSTYHFIPFFHVGISVGSVKSRYKQGSPATTPIDISSNGSTSGFSVGFGYKFYTQKGFGARAMLDYYSRAEKYKEDDAGFTFSKVVSGPRLLLGLSYRF